jgi:hypothetical protein
MGLQAIHGSVQPTEAVKEHASPKIQRLATRQAKDKQVTKKQSIRCASWLLQGHPRAKYKCRRRPTKAVRKRETIEVYQKLEAKATGQVGYEEILPTSPP